MRNSKTSISLALMALLMAHAPASWAETTQADEGAAITESDITAEANDEEVALDDEEFAVSDVVLGEADAPITIYVYASFTCPHCQAFEAEVMPEIEANYIETGKANLIYREVYRDGMDILAGSMARCVPEEQYYPMINALYADIPNWLYKSETPADAVTALTKIGVLAGLPKEQISQCLDDREMQELRFNYSNENMKQDEVKGTPTIIVNGQHAPSPVWENLQQFLDQKLEEAEAS